MLSIPGVWWVDLQIDGVRRGYVTSYIYTNQSLVVAKANSIHRQLNTSSDHLPRAGTIIASSFTSPLDPLYLAGIFQPIFTRSYPYTRKVERITLFRAILLAWAPPALLPPLEAKLYTLHELTSQYPSKIICVFPETTTTNGRGILPLSPSLLSASGTTKIYAVNLRYTPQDITTPIPGGYISWIWKLLHKPSHQMRVRIATKIYNSASQDEPSKTQQKAVGSGYDTNIFDQPAFKENGRDDGWGTMKVDVDGGSDDAVRPEEQAVLDRVGEDLAWLGRVKRVGLGVEDKIEFLKVWGKRRR
jgi:1-acyl-sn-glycerol-3-phosphate acyltransferase